MFRIALKFFLTASIIVGVSEISKRSTLLGSVLASLPLVSLLAMVWMYSDSGDPVVPARFAKEIFWMVLPSLSFFVIFPAMVARGQGFWPAMGVSTVLMTLFYFGVMGFAKWRGFI